MTESLEATVDRLASSEAIRQLACRYAVAVDTRQLDHLVSLFVEDVRVGRDRSGRAALRAWFDGILRNRFTQTCHFVGNHLIEFEDPDRAHGLVHCRAEHEVGERFVVLQMQYRDRYERVGGEWYFRRRRPLYWYAVDWSDRPVGPRKIRWPDAEAAEGELPGHWPSWEAFWSRAPEGEAELGPLPPPGRFLRTLGGG